MTDKVATLSVCCGRCGKVASRPLPIERLGELPQEAAAFGWDFTSKGGAMPWLRRSAMMTDEPTATVPPTSPMPQLAIPSWMRWPPNCCETCVNWRQNTGDRWVGVCKANLLELEDETDARFRCPSFVRRKGV